MGKVAATSILLLLLLPPSLAVGPGLRTVITSKGLDYVHQVGLPILEQSLSSLSIPDISGSADDVSYQLSNIKLAGISIPTSSLTTNSKGLEVKASGISMKVTANWHYRMDPWPHISDSGSADVSVSSVSLTVGVDVGADATGHATLSPTICSLDIGKLDIDFHGGASWLYNLFSSYIAGTLKGSIQGQVCSAATEAIKTQGNAALESLPVVVKLDSISEINYALLQPPTFTSAYVETNHKGEFFAIAKPIEAPFSPPPLPTPTTTSAMMYLWLTDYIANTAGYVYQSSGFMNYNITPNMIPKNIPIQLNTSSFRLFLPQLYEKFPNQAMMLELTATEPPNLVINPSTANFTVPGEVKVYVINANKSIQLAFVMGIVVYADVKVWVHSDASKEIISANATFLRADLSLVSSNIGQFSISVLQAAANLLSEGFVIPVINRYGNAGLPLPTVEGISFVDSSITLAQGYVVVGTDFSYKPSFLHKAGSLHQPPDTHRRTQQRLSTHRRTQQRLDSPRPTRLRL